MGEVCKAVNAAVAGKGGGNPSYAAGSTAREITPELAEMLRSYLDKLVKEGTK